MKVQLLDPNAKPPVRKTEGAGGYDIYTTESVQLWLADMHPFKTGIAVEIPQGWVGLIKPRSGLAMARADTLAGVVDSDYRGELKILLINHSEDMLRIEKGERIAQLVIAPVVRAEFHPVDTLDETTRGEGGFGSTAA